LLEFSGACAGCPQASLLKLLTQLFGRNSVFSNASGCAMVWGGWFPINPYGVDSEGRGPVFTHSLFEDNAQYGYGQVRAYNNRLKNYLSDV